ncbi:hypothetical protein BDZ89DRAFT_1078695 [Hymenopellis radicata]|nr:hypothetical protein BDZ89DRAFT_1078695 [Hymenopellis radicata]
MPMINDDDHLEDDERGILHLPWLGSFMAFSIDPAATLRYYCQGGDAVAKELAQDLACKQYAGYCVRQWNGGLPDPEAAFNRMWLRPIQIGLTKPRPNRTDKFKRKTADMCVPILPTTEHPLGRTPLPISHPLPWSNCYQPTMDDFDVLVEPQNYDYSNTPHFPSTAMSAISRYTSEDVTRINAMEAECTVGALEAQGAVVNNNDSSDSDSIQSVGDYAPSLGDDIDAVENIFFSSVNAPMWNKIFTPAIKINSDLGVIKVLSDPVELWDEHATLKRIVDECKARQRAASRGLGVTCGPESCPRSRGTQSSLRSSFSEFRRRMRTKIVSTFTFKRVRG